MAKRKSKAEEAATAAVADAIASKAVDDVEADIKAEAEEIAKAKDLLQQNRGDGRTHFGQWAKGNQLGRGGNGGRTMGRKKTIRVLDAVLSDPNVQRAFAQALTEEAMKGGRAALETLRTIVLPIIPKEMLQDEPAADADQRGQGQQRLGVRMTMPDGSTVEATTESTQPKQVDEQADA